MAHYLRAPRAGKWPHHEPEAELGAERSRTPRRDRSMYLCAHRTPAGAISTFVGFSMGGLVSRYYVQRLGGLDHVDRLVTLSAPHNGSLLANLIANKGCREMRPGSPSCRTWPATPNELEKIKAFRYVTLHADGPGHPPGAQLRNASGPQHPPARSHASTDGRGWTVHARCGGGAPVVRTAEPAKLPLTKRERQQAPQQFADLHALLRDPSSR